MQSTISFGIHKISELEYTIHQPESLRDDELGVNFQVSSFSNIENNEFDVQIMFDLKRKETDEILAHIKVSTVFKIENLISYKEPDKDVLNLPDALLVSMLSISISHTRAILAKNTVGTSLADFYIPLINPTEVAKKVFNIGVK